MARGSQDICKPDGIGWLPRILLGDRIDPEIVKRYLQGFSVTCESMPMGRLGKDCLTKRVSASDISGWKAEWSTGGECWCNMSSYLKRCHQDAYQQFRSVQDRWKWSNKYILINSTGVTNVMIEMKPIGYLACRRLKALDFFRHLSTNAKSGKAQWWNMNPSHCPQLLSRS